MSIEYKEINQLTVATVIIDADLFEIEQGGVSKQITASILIATLLKGVKGKIIDGNITYLSSNTILMNPIDYHFKNSTSDYWIQISTSTVIASAMSNFPASAAGAFICGDEEGTITLEASTGTGAQRATNNEFQLTGGGVGYDDINYGGYYINGKRILGHIFCVTATSFYITKLLDGVSEIGQNSLGRWSRTHNKIKIIIGITTPTANANTNYTLPVGLKTFVATAGIGECGIASNYYPSTGVATLYAWLTNANAMSYFTTVVQPCYFVIDGYWF